MEMEGGNQAGGEEKRERERAREEGRERGKHVGRHATHGSNRCSDVAVAYDLIAERDGSQLFFVCVCWKCVHAARCAHAHNKLEDARNHSQH